jgi:hypothetical protein
VRSYVFGHKNAIFKVWWLKRFLVFFGGFGEIKLFENDS